VTTKGRVPPYDLAAEESLLGACLITPAAIAASVDICSPDDFHRPAHVHIYNAITDLYRNGVTVDGVTVADHLRRHHLLDAIGGAAVLTDLEAKTPATASAGRYAAIVAEYSAARQMIAAADEIAEMGYRGADDIGGKLWQARALLDGVGMIVAPRGLPLATVADVASERVQWLWPGRLARGKLTILDGDPDQGKSTMSLDVGARVSTGSSMPDGHRLDEPGDVLVLSAEDDLADTIRPRLEAAGANLERIHVVDLSRAEDVTFPAHVPDLEVDVIKHSATLVIVDPLVAFLSAGIDSHRDQDVRRALFALGAMATRTGAAVLTVRHLNKTTGQSALYRGGGSIGIIGAVRLGLLVGFDPDDDSRRLLASSKCNLTAKPPTLAYRLVPDDLRGVAWIEWHGPVDVTADELVAVRQERGHDPEETSALDDASAFLTQLLAEGDRWTKEVRDQTTEAGLSWITVRRAKDRLGVVAVKVGRPKDPEQGWKWHLPCRTEDAHETPKELTKKDRASSVNVSTFGTGEPDPGP
jgi:hypothetical protein